MGAGNLTSENGGDFFRLHRPADQKPLCQVAIATLQKFELRQRLDAFGGHLDIESLRHRDGGTHNALVAIIALDVGDQ